MNVFGFQVGSQGNLQNQEPTAPSYFQGAIDELGSTAAAFAMHAGQGLTLNFGDELAAALMTPYEVMTTEDSGKGFWERVGDTYSDLNQTYNERLEQARAEHPYASIAGELTGGVALGLAAAPVASGIGLARGGMIASKLASPGGAAGLGAVNGFGSGRTLEERYNAALNGAVIGGAVGKLAPHLAEYGEAAYRKAADYARAWKNPAPAVDAEVGRLASKAKTSVEGLAASLEGAATDGQTQFAVVDALFNLGRNELAKLAPVLKPDALRALSIRQNSQFERLGVLIRDAFDAQKTAAEFKRELMARGAPSRSIDAVDAGIHAQGIRADPSNTIPDYLARSADEQSSFRVGYADPHLAQLEALAGTSPANRASMFQTERTAQELPVFASPGKGERLMRQIGREDEMFKTGAEVLRAGGSPASSGFGRDVVDAAADVAGGNFGSALVRLGSPFAAKLRPQKLDEAVADALLSTDAGMLREMGARSAQRSIAVDARRAKIVSALLGAQAASTSENRMLSEWK
ncbi:hypothetical protein LUX29_17820 [Aureimonas altamirensis]|uniref:hypothetical protein n=1 Tax=Aureimonas altamirensis TaxID=370622 RepID=UPI001E3AD9EF|nr:hypothetical protein [Aureimonas altamirensis]UHD44864.1 hypothetical protein LUX29_17820 [Aureimonas altamirensis]